MAALGRVARRGFFARDVAWTLGGAAEASRNVLPCRLPRAGCRSRTFHGTAGNRAFQLAPWHLRIASLAVGAGAAFALSRTEVAAEAPSTSVSAKRSDPAAEACVRDLRARFGEKFSDDLALRTSRNRDSMSYYVGGTPQAVVFAETEQDVVDAVKICRLHRVPIIPWGAGTSIEGQLTPTDRGGIVIDLRGMDAIVALHAEDMDAVVQAGKSWLDLNAELKDHGLFFAPDPGPGASLGGMCGTSCSGTRAWRYGTMKENVLGLRVVLSDGKVITTRRRPPKSSAGYDLTRLFIGSEGTLGIITEVTVKLRRIPERHEVAVACFDSIEDAGKLVHAIVSSGLALNRLELMDELAVRAANNFPGAPIKLPERATLLIDFAGTKESIAQQKSEVAELAKRHRLAHWRESTGDSDYADIWNIRRSAIYYNFTVRTDNCDPAQLALISTDSCVPISALPAAMREAQKLREEMGLAAPIVAHAGDGNFHCALSVKKDDPKELEAAKKFQDILSERAILLGGTCTGEHGVGKSKMRFLELELGREALEAMWAIKNALDPDNLFNPGHTLPELDPGAK
ncbi:putative d-lactate dehydrogenase [Hyaloraphidium curvatum]|nr:putative d-lactate dehydrogenase [Hyaloraphidium curvatum]